MVVLKNVKTLLVVTVAAVMMDTNWRMTITHALILTSVPLIMEDVNNIVIILLAAIVVLVLRDTSSLAIIMNVKVLSEYLHSNFVCRSWSRQCTCHIHYCSYRQFVKCLLHEPDCCIFMNNTLFVIQMLMNVSWIMVTVINYVITLLDLLAVLVGLDLI